MPDPVLIILGVLLLLFFLFAGGAICPETLRGKDASARMAAGYVLFTVIYVVPLAYGANFLLPHVVALILLAVGIVRARRGISLSWPFVLFWLMFLLNFSLLSAGTVKNTGLGDHDPYEHAMAISYIYETGSVYPAGDSYLDFSTLDPYPPGYDVSAAAISRMGGGVGRGLRVWALVNAAIFPVAVRFWARGMGLSSGASYIAGAAACLLPPAPTHFAWSHTHGINITLILASSISFLMKRGGRRWLGVATVSATAFLFSATSELFYGLLLFIPVIARGIREGFAGKLLPAVICAILLFLPWGMHVVERFSADERGILDVMGTRHFAVLRGHHDDPGEKRSIWKEHRGNARPYEWHEFLLPPDANYFNTPVGLPAGMFIPGVVALFLWRRRGVIWPVSLFLFFMVMVQGERLPFEFFPHRVWTYLALLCAFGAGVLHHYRHSLGIQSRPLLYPVIFLAALSIAHSAWTRLKVELNPWGNEIFMNAEQKEGYYALTRILNNEKTYPVTGGIRFGYIAAFGGRVPFWEEKEREADRLIGGGKFAEAVAVLKTAGYSYLVLDDTINLRMGENVAEGIYMEMMERGGVKPVMVKAGFALLKLVP